MTLDPESKSARDALDDAKQSLGALADKAGDQVRPVVKFGVGTADNIVSAVESAKSARTRVWNALTKLSDRAKADKESGTKSDDSEESAELGAAASDVLASAASAQTAVAGIWKMLTDVGSGTGEDGKPRSSLDPRRWVSETPNVVGKVADTVGLRGDTSEDVRAMGDRLIAESQIPKYTAGGRHPAFVEILKQMNPDEARIVRFLYKAGVQPSIDIRTKTLFQIGSERILGGVNMVAEMASCRWPNSSREYLGNLNRLGLVRFSSEPVEDIRRYSLLEVQPVAMDAIASVKSAICIYRSIYLSEFGRQFAEISFDMSGYTGGGWDSDGRSDKILGSGPPKPKKHGH
jgi:hypothetical protein